MGFRALGQFGQFRRDLGQKPPLHVRFVDGEKLAGAVVDGRDAPHAVQADDPGADA
ncbi:hypothetical protein D3C80_2055740 [compost metagenome]